MLLEFKTKNYKSFADELCFSMTPAPKQKGLDYSILEKRIGSKTYKGLCAAVVYGPNASGKTNIIGAMDTFREIVLRGNIRNAEVVSPNTAAYSLELVPNCNAPAGPTEFGVRYVDDDMMVEYAVSLNLGPFMEKNYKRKVLEERLIIDEKQVFLRKEGTFIVEFPGSIKPYVNKRIKKVTKKVLDFASYSLSDSELFLTNGFKNLFAQELVGKILSWFENKFTVVYHADDVRFPRKVANPKENTIYVEKTIAEAVKVFGVTTNTLGYKISNEKDEELELYSILHDKLLPAEMFESYGTIRFINEFPIVVHTLLNGETLVVDEFDASIHPMVLMDIINIFHNDELNKRNAQLIFNTHNPIFLDSSLLRRDEIKFVERDEKTGNSVHYALSDFRTADGIRKGEDYMKNYFVNRYGAIKEVELSPIIERAIEESEEKKYD